VVRLSGARRRPKSTVLAFILKFRQMSERCDFNLYLQYAQCPFEKVEVAGLIGTPLRRR